MDLGVKASNGDIFNFPVDVLRKESDFFKALFWSGMKESQMNKVELPTVSSETLAQIQR